ncbi:MAG TPA: hypothetical protein VGC29_00815 [Flavisolibacter sp.]
MRMNILNKKSNTCRYCFSNYDKWDQIQIPFESFVFFTPWQSRLVAAQELMVTINTANTPKMKKIRFICTLLIVLNVMIEVQE